MKRNLMFLVLCVFSIATMAQQAFKGSLSCKEENLHLTIDLYEESINVPGMEMFGPMHGYLKIVNATTALIRLSNDQGSETQEVKLTKNDDQYIFEQVDGVCIKKVEGRKLVKIPKKLIFKLNK